MSVSLQVQRKQQRRQDHNIFFLYKINVFDKGQNLENIGQKSSMSAVLTHRASIQGLFNIVPWREYVGCTDGTIGKQTRYKFLNTL